jgi:hypothetical protein
MIILSACNSNKILKDKNFSEIKHKKQHKTSPASFLYMVILSAFNSKKILKEKHDNFSEIKDKNHKTSPD